MLIWISGHVGTLGNDTGHIYIKRAINSPEFTLAQIWSLSDIKEAIRYLILKEWQLCWKFLHIKHIDKTFYKLLTNIPHQKTSRCYNLQFNNTIYLADTWINYKTMRTRPMLKLWRSSNRQTCPNLQ